MITTHPSSFAIAAGLSLAASIVLVLVTFVFPNTPLGPFIFANWVFFMVAGYLGCPRPFWRDFFAKPDPEKWKVLRLVLVAFTVAGWIAIFNGNVDF